MTIAYCLKQNSLPIVTYCHYAYLATMLQTLVYCVANYNQSLIFICFQHVNLDAW